jgi:hypothetical protein
MKNCPVKKITYSYSTPSHFYVNPIHDAFEPLKSGIRSIILDFCDLETAPTSLTHFSLESLFIHEGNVRLTPTFRECREDGDITVIMKYLCGRAEYCADACAEV